VGSCGTGLPIVAKNWDRGGGGKKRGGKGQGYENGQRGGVIGKDRGGQIGTKVKEGKKGVRSYLVWAGSWLCKQKMRRTEATQPLSRCNR